MRVDEVTAMPQKCSMLGINNYELRLCDRMALLVTAPPFVEKYRKARLERDQTRLCVGVVAEPNATPVWFDYCPFCGGNMRGWL